MHETIKKMVHVFEKQREQRRRACAVFTALAILVSLTTTYMLVQPANTMAVDYVCGMEAHTHSEECYRLICDYADEAEKESFIEQDAEAEEPAPDAETPEEVLDNEETLGGDKGAEEPPVTEEPAEEEGPVEEPNAEEEPKVEEPVVAPEVEQPEEEEAEAEPEQMETPDYQEPPAETEQPVAPAPQETPVVVEKVETPDVQEAPAAPAPVVEVAPTATAASETAADSGSETFTGAMSMAMVMYTNGPEVASPDEPASESSDTTSASVETPAEAPVVEAPVVETPVVDVPPVVEESPAEDPVIEDVEEDTSITDEPAEEPEVTEEPTDEETTEESSDENIVGEDSDIEIVEQEVSSGGQEVGHVHTAACYELICDFPEHEHSEDCMSLMNLLEDLGELPEGYTNEYSVFGDGYTVAVFAPDGALPEGVELVATLLEEGDAAHATAQQTLEAMVAQEVEVNVAGVMSEAAKEEAAASVSEDAVPVEPEEAVEEEQQIPVEDTAPVESEESAVIEETEITESIVDETVEEEPLVDPEPVEEEPVIQEEPVVEEASVEAEVLTASLVHNDNAPVEETPEDVAEIAAEVEEPEAVPEEEVLETEVIEEVTKETEEAVAEDPVPYEEEFSYDGFVALDIHFELDGEEIEPARPVFVYIDVNGLLPETADPDSVKILHIKEEKTEEEFTLLEKLIPTLTPSPVVESVEVVADENENTGLVEAGVENVTTFFAVDSFSIFPIVWSGTSYVGTKLSSELSGSSYDARYDIKTLPVTLIDYDPGSMSAWMDINRSENAVHGMEFHGFERWSGYGGYPNKPGTDTKMTASEFYALTGKGVNAGGRIIKQGILSNVLGTDGLPEMNYGNHATANRTQIIDLLFNDDDLEHNWSGYSAHDPSVITKAKTVYEDVDMEFVYDNETGYYIYNSVANHAQFNGEDEIELYMDTLSPRIATSEEDSDSIEENKAGFYPFNDIAKSYENTDDGALDKMNGNLSTWAAHLDTQEYTYANRAASHQTSSLAAEHVGDLNNHFGMKLEFNFYLPQNGMLDDGTPLIFEFNGDDDLWVYIDGKLVLDMGGAHSRSGGYIDFSDGGTVFVENAVNIADALNLGSNEMNPVDVTRTFEQLGLSGDNAIAEKRIHTVKIFYMERFGSVSNCFMKFNMPVVPDGNLMVTKEVTGVLSEQTTAKMDYTFRLTGGDNAAIVNEPYAVYSSDGGGAEIMSSTTDANGYFTLKANQMAIFTKMTGLSNVYVEELLLDGTDAKKYTDAAKTTVSVNDAPGVLGMKTGLIGIVPGEQQRVVFNNSLAAGDLAINKSVNRTDRMEQGPTDFTFQLKAAALAGNSYNDGAVVFDSNGVANITVTSGTPFTITALPAGQVIEISETNYDGYAPSFSANNTDWTAGATTSVTVGAGNVINVYCRNTTGAELPSTGGIGTNHFTTLGIALMLGAGVLLLDQRRRREGTSAT